MYTIDIAVPETAGLDASMISGAVYDGLVAARVSASYSISTSYSTVCGYVVYNITVTMQ